MNQTAGKEIGRKIYKLSVVKESVCPVCKKNGMVGDIYISEMKENIYLSFVSNVRRMLNLNGKVQNCYQY